MSEAVKEKEVVEAPIEEIIEGEVTVEREVGERVDVLCTLEPNSVKELGEGSFSAIVTTSAVDRMRESIDSSGITTDAYMQNPVVLYGHDYSGLPIGKATNIKQYKNKITAEFQLAVNEYPFAATVAAMIKGGYLNAVSIGGIVKEWNEDYTVIRQMEMVEFSVVPVPANPQALISGRSFEKAIGKSAEQIATEYAEFAQKATADKLKGLDKNELHKHIESLESLLAVLKDTASVIERGEEAETEITTIRLRKAAGHVSQTGQDIIKLVKSTN